MVSSEGTKVEAIDSSPLKRRDVHEMDGLTDRIIIASNHVNKQAKRRATTVTTLLAYGSVIKNIGGDTPKGQLFLTKKTGALLPPFIYFKR